MPQGEGAPASVAEQTGEPRCHTALKVWLFSEWHPDALLQASFSCSSFLSWQRSWPHWTQSSGCTLASRLLGGCSVPAFAAVLAPNKHIIRTHLKHICSTDTRPTLLHALPSRGVLALLPFYPRGCPSCGPAVNLQSVFISSLCCTVAPASATSASAYLKNLLSTPDRPAALQPDHLLRCIPGHSQQPKLQSLRALCSAPGSAPGHCSHVSYVTDSGMSAGLCWFEVLWPLVA